MELHTKLTLDALVRQGCTDSHCTGDHGPLEKIWLHASCHSSWGLRCQYRQPDVLELACGACGKLLLRIQTALHAAGKIRQACRKHARKRLLWVCYEAGVVTIICRRCRALVAKIAVVDAGGQAANQEHA